MSENLEEMREMRRNQGDLMGKLSELCGQVRELVIELRHTQKDYQALNERTQKDYQALNERTLKTEQDIRALQLDSALNKPILDIAKSINSKMWIAIIGAIVSVGAGNIDWSKFTGF